MVWETTQTNYSLSRKEKGRRKTRPLLGDRRFSLKIKGTTTNAKRTFHPTSHKSVDATGGLIPRERGEIIAETGPQDLVKGTTKEGAGGQRRTGEKSKKLNNR